MEIKVNDINGLQTAAQAFIKAMADRRIFAFYGNMGAGKTTFIKAVCEQLGVGEVITSPTFAIVNEYSFNDRRSNEAKTIYHFDFYRIQNIREAYDIGLEEYFYSKAICFIEWPEIVDDLLPADAVKVTISVADDDTRIVTIS